MPLYLHAKLAPGVHWAHRVGRNRPARPATPPSEAAQAIAWLVGIAVAVWAGVAALFTHGHPIAAAVLLAVFVGLYGWLAVWIARQRRGASTAPAASTGPPTPPR